MKIAKNSRQEMIIKLIRENNISTQDELTELVKKNGFDATQATCSRDIKELGIIKITLPNNTSVYHVLERTGDIAPGKTFVGVHKFYCVSSVSDEYSCIMVSNADTNF